GFYTLAGTTSGATLETFSIRGKSDPLLGDDVTRLRGQEIFHFRVEGASHETIWSGRFPAGLRSLQERAIGQARGVTACGVLREDSGHCTREISLATSATQALAVTDVDAGSSGCLLFTANEGS